MASPWALSWLTSMRTNSEKTPVCIMAKAVEEPTNPQPMTAAF